MPKVYKYYDILNEEKEYDFQSGDRIRCISPNSDNEKFALDKDGIYTIFKIVNKEDGKIKIGLVEKPGLLYAPGRFQSLRDENDDDVEELNYEPWFDEDVRRKGPRIKYKIVHNYPDKEMALILRKVDARQIEYSKEGDNNVVVFFSTNDKRDITEDLKQNYEEIIHIYSSQKKK